MLMKRTMTAIVMLLVVGGVLLSSNAFPFVVFTSLAIAVAQWEWSKLNGADGVQALVNVAFFAVMAVVSMSMGWVDDLLLPSLSPLPWLKLHHIWLGCVGLWALCIMLMLQLGVSGWRRTPMLVRQALGLIVLWAAWLATIRARHLGVGFLLSAMALVWASDTLAYFTGKWLGGRFIQQKLAAHLSPGKTWEGALGAFVGVYAMVGLWAVFFTSNNPADSNNLYALLIQLPWHSTFLAILLLVSMGVCGDLFESMVKRQAHVKDSSQLLPGHGGVLDRIDALLPVMPLVMLFATWLGVA